MHKDLCCCERTKQAGEFSAQPSGKSVNDEAGRRGSLNFFNRISARKFNWQFWVQNHNIKVWKSALSLPGKWRIAEDADAGMCKSCQRYGPREVSPAAAERIDEPLRQISLRTCLLQIVCVDGPAFLRRLP